MSSRMQSNPALDFLICCSFREGTANRRDLTKGEISCQSFIITQLDTFNGVVQALHIVCRDAATDGFSRNVTSHVQACDVAQLEPSLLLLAHGH